MDQNSINKRFTDITSVSVNEELRNLRKLIYSNATISKLNAQK